MALSTAQLAALRAELGSATPPTDTDLNTLFASLGSTQAVALAVLRDRLATPTSVDVGGEYHETFDHKALEAQLARVAAGPTDLAVGATVGLATLVRTARRRRPLPVQFP